MVRYLVLCIVLLGAFSLGQSIDNLLLKRINSSQKELIYKLKKLTASQEKLLLKLLEKQHGVSEQEKAEPLKI